MTTCEELREQFHKDIDTNTLKQIWGIGAGTIESAVFDTQIRNTMIIENASQMALEKLSTKIANKVATKLLTSVLSGYGILTDLGDILDIFDALFGPGFSVLMDRPGLNLFYNNIKTKFNEMFTSEYQTCLFNLFKEQYPNLSDKQISDFVAKTVSLFSVSSGLPSDLNITSDCFSRVEYDGQTYLSTNVSGTCPLLYKQFFRGYVKSNK